MRDEGIAVRRSVLIAVMTLGLTSCARVVAPLAPGSATEPRVSWVIRSGPPDSNEAEMCRSDRQQPCVLQASSAARPMSVVVAVYMYAAGAPTQYSGAFQAGFMEAANQAGYETKVDYSIGPRGLPTAVAASGRITPRAGEYALRLALFATVPDQMDPHQFEQIVAVRVIAAGQTTARR
jgi:hypothetical protein